MNNGRLLLSGQEEELLAKVRGKVFLVTAPSETELYRKVAEKNGYEASQQDILKNYLFLYEPEEQYLIFAGGSDSDFSFETLEKIAENMEIKVTSFPARPMREERSYLFLDLGRG